MNINERYNRRRVLLRGLGLFGGLALVAAGCDGGGSDGGNDGGTASSNSDGGGKMAKESVNYQTSPKGNQQCSNCANYIASENGCRIVKGDIAPEAWCTQWTRAA